MDLRETRLDSETVYDGALLRVQSDRVRLPDGGASVREWIAHPGASAIVPLFADGTTVLVRQFRYPPQREFLEVPAGKHDRPAGGPAVGADEAEATARRELREETGLDARRWTHLGATYPGIGYSDERIELYLAEDLTQRAQNADADEFVEPVRMPFADAVARARRGELLDAKTCVAVLMADAHLAGRG